MIAAALALALLAHPDAPQWHVQACLLAEAGSCGVAGERYPIEVCRAIVERLADDFRAVRFSCVRALGPG